MPAYTFRRYFNSVFNYFFSDHRMQRAQKPNPYRPRLEVLGDRIAPATLTWVGDNNDLWSNMASWRDENMNQATPAVGDTVLFNEGDTTSVVDTNFQGTVAAMVLSDEFTGTIKLERTLQTGGLEQSTGTIDGPFGLTVTTGYNWSGGTLRGSGNPETNYVRLTGQANVFKGEDLSLDGRAIKNAGFIDWQTPEHFVESTITAVNNGLIINEQNAVLSTSGNDYSVFTGQGAFFNDGTVTTTQQAKLKVDVTASISGGMLTSDSILRFNAYTVFIGDIEANGTGRLNLFGTTTIQGTLRAPNGTLIVSLGGTTSISGSLLLSNTATHSITGTTSVGGLLKVWANSDMNQSGNLNVNAGSVENKSATRWLWGGGNIYIADGATFANTNRFVCNVSGDASISGPGAFVNSGQMEEVGPFFFSGDLTISSQFDNSGRLTVIQKKVIMSASWTQVAGGELRFVGAFAVFQVNGTFTNDGTISVSLNSEIDADNVVNNGTIAFPEAAAGEDGFTLSIRKRSGQVNGGDFTQTANGILSMSLTDEGTPGNCDTLDVEGTATLGGTWNVVLANGLVVFDEFWFPIQAATIVQQFATANLPPGFNPPTYTATYVMVDNIQPPPPVEEEVE